MKRFGFIAIVASAILLVACNQKKQQAPADNEPTVEIGTSEEEESSDSISAPLLKDFTMNDVKGNPVNILDEVAKNQLTIIDFWASWCGPCRAEMPNLVKLYAEQKDKGLGITGISLDEDLDSWKNAIEKDGITWLQLSDLQGWENAAARMYNVNSIPYMMVVSTDGSIIAEGLRGKELEDFIKLNL